MEVAALKTVTEVTYAFIIMFICLLEMEFCFGLFAIIFPEQKDAFIIYMNIFLHISLLSKERKIGRMLEIDFFYK